MDRVEKMLGRMKASKLYRCVDWDPEGKAKDLVDKFNSASRSETMTRTGEYLGKLFAHMGKECYHFDVRDGSSVVVVDDDFLLLPVAFTRSEDDGSCNLDHGDEIGHHDGLRKEVFVSAEQVGALPFPSALRIPISSVRSPQ